MILSINLNFHQISILIILRFKTSKSLKKINKIFPIDFSNYDDN